MSDRICLLAPSVRRGNGMGHLIRCAGLVPRIPGSRLYLPQAGSPGFFSLEELLRVLPEEFPRENLITAVWEGPVPLAVLDRRCTAAEDLALFPPGTLFAGVDEGNRRIRKDCFYLADTLPGLKDRRLSNRRSPGLLEGPSRKRGFPESFREILVSFGGEDPAGLTGLVLKGLLPWLESPESRGIRITVLRGFTGKTAAGASGTGGEAGTEAGAGNATSGVSAETSGQKLPVLREMTPEASGKILVIPPVPSLKEHLADYDLVLTSYGLTAWEALRAGAGVLLVNPSSYHRKLSRRSGLPCLGMRSFSLKAFLNHLGNPRGLERSLAPLAPAEGPELGTVLRELRAEEPVCPGCGRPARGGGLSGDTGKSGLPGSSRILARFPRRTWYRCRGCSLVYQNLHTPPEVQYGEDYFFRDYQKQYGKTYLEDFPQLREMARRRLDILDSLVRGRRGLLLLEIGCAYGAFLAEARERGYRSAGIDISAPAAEYARTSLGLDVKNVPMEELELPRLFGESSADIIVLWYVIEHFPDLMPILVKLSELQKPGGILAFSTPNFTGISGRVRKKQFLDRSPLDHYHIWSPRIARRVLKLYGYSVRRVRVTGHHPERFLLAGGIRPDGPAGRLLAGISRFFRLGDTFEIYCVKTGKAKQQRG